MKTRIFTFLLLLLTASVCLGQTFGKQGAGVTIIVHGWDPDGNQPAWMASMADAIIERNGGVGHIATITVTGTKNDLTATCSDWDLDLATQSYAEVVVLINWTAVANHLLTGVPAQEVAAAVAPRIYEPQSSQPALAELPIHLIGHSRGGGMVFEIARLLGLQGVEVDQVTALDPHPLTVADPQGADPPFGPGSTIDTPIAVYENILFVDNYYQTIEAPIGEYVNGAYNRLWTSLLGGYHNETGYTYNIGGTEYNFSDHLNIILAYHGTIDLATSFSNGEATMGETERGWFNAYENGGENTGFKYSRQIMGNRKSAEIPVADGDAIIDGFHNNALLGGNGARESLIWTSAVWPNVLEIIVADDGDALESASHTIFIDDELNIEILYRSFANAGNITFYVDTDRNPYNGHTATIATHAVTSTGSSITSLAKSWVVEGVTEGQKYYIYANFNDGSRERFLYAPLEFEIALPPVGSGTEVKPYQIATLQNLLWITQDVSRWDKHYIQTDDIDASETSTWNGGEGWKPIGEETIPNDEKGWKPIGEEPTSKDYEKVAFSGNYNGQGHTISGLFINIENADNIGLFGYVDGASARIENLGVINADINMSGDNADCTGLLVGKLNSGEIINCYTSGEVTGFYSVGGLVGENYMGTVINSYSNGSVSGSGNVGGLVGYNTYEAPISNSYSTADVTGGNYVGGLVGYNEYSTITNCYSTGLVTGDDNVGGLVGKNDEGTVINSYSTADVTGDNYVGGLVGYNQLTSTITNCYSTGLVTGTSNFGGLIGYNEESDVTNSFWDKETSGQTSSAGGSGAVGKTTAEMNSYFTFFDAGWDFRGETENGTDDIWNIGNGRNDGYPYHNWQYPTDPDPCFNPTHGGEIAGEQTICYSTTPTALTSNSGASGELGTLEYKWQSSTTDATGGFSDISGTNAATYAPGDLTETAWFKRLARAECKPDWVAAAESNVIQVTVLPEFTPGTISSTGEDVCFGDTPSLTITSSNPASGGDDNISYQWQSCTDGTFGDPVIIAENFATYTPPSDLSATTWYRRQAKDSECNTTWETSEGVWKVAIFQVFTAGTIEDNGETICYAGNPAVIGSTTAASGGDADITYRWQSSTNEGFTTPIDIASNTATFTPPTGLTATTWYRRQAKDGLCNTAWETSDGVWKVTVLPEFTPGAIATTGETISYAGTPGIIGSVTAASGGDDVITYRWQSSTNEGFSSPTDIVSNTATYTPPAGLTVTTWYRRQAKDGLCNTVWETSTGVWKVTVMAQTFTVTYNANSTDATGSAPVDTDEYEEGDEVTVLGQGTLALNGYTFEGWNTQADGAGTSYEEDDTFDMPASNVTLYAIWEVIPDKEITAVSSIADIVVDYGTELSNVPLPQTVKVTLDDASTMTLDVTWDGGTPEYDEETAGIYVFEGTLTLIDGVANTAEHTASVNVRVRAEDAEDNVIVSVAAIADITVPHGTTLAALPLPTTVQVTLDDDSNINLAVTWDDGTPGYDGNIASTYVFEGTLTLVTGVTNPDELTASVNVIVEDEDTPDPDKYTVTFAVEGGNGSLVAEVDGEEISSGDEVEEGKDVVFAATPAEGYRVKEWTINGEAVADHTENIFTVSSLSEDINVTVEFEAITGVEEVTLSNLKAYPNPFRSYITLDNAQGVSKVIITNLIGQKVMEIQLSGVERESIQTDGLIRGVYLITFQAENGEKVVRKMIKE